MAKCKSCGGGKRREGICDVHRLVHNDSSLRMVRYCNVCDAWVCAACKNNWAKRGYAALLKSLGK